MFAGPPPASVHPEALWFPAQATRPPVTRVKLAVWEMSEQHELSVIPEVETPVNTSLVPGQLHAAPQHHWANSEPCWRQRNIR